MAVNPFDVAPQIGLSSAGNGTYISGVVLRTNAQRDLLLAPRNVKIEGLGRIIWETK